MYNDKKYTIAQIKEALLNDYKGNKDQTIMQTMFQMKAPKYGNNDDEIDEIGGKVMETWCNECWKYKTPNDFQFRPRMLSWNYRADPDASKCVATPNGRNSVSYYKGCS